MSQPEAEPLSRMDLARAQLRDSNLTPGEHQVAWSIIFLSPPPSALHDADFSNEVA